MATLQSPGVGSGLDIGTLVQQLVAAERTPIEKRIVQRESKLTAQLSALSTLKGALSAFQSALESLKTESAFLVRKASTSDSEVLSATATSTAAPASYDIEVVQLATAHQIASSPFADGADSVVGTGTLTISLGDQTFTVTVGEDQSTLAGIRDAINSAEGNPGVRATLIHGVDGSRLVLTASETGATNTIRVTASGGDGGLDALTYDPPTTTNMTELRAAANALIRVAGIDHESASNVIEGAIDGVSLSLVKAAPGTQITLTVGIDTAQITERINKFVTEYNNLNSKMASLRTYDATNRQAGPMFGDALLRSIEDQIRRGLTGAVEGLTGDYQTLSSLGIKTTATGALTIDDAKLRAALEADLEGVAAIFGSENGIAARLHEQIEARLDVEGAIEARTQSLRKRIDSLTDERDALDLRMAKLEERYLKQFTALDQLLANLQSTSAYLTQQLANLPKIGGKD